MIPISYLFENISEEYYIPIYEIELDPKLIKNERDLVRWGKQKGVIPRESRGLPVNLKPGEFKVPMKSKTKIKMINPRTGRLKNKKKLKYLVTKIKPEDRSFKNLPRYADKKPKVTFQRWLEFTNTSRSKHSVAKGCDGKWYGWSHRAVYGFKIGTVVKPGTIGNKYQYGPNAPRYGSPEYDEKYKEAGKFKPYTIKTDDEAFEHAERFAKDVS